jgi:hypothetical protein
MSAATWDRGTKAEVTANADTLNGMLDAKSAEWGVAADQVTAFRAKLAPVKAALAIDETHRTKASNQTLAEDFKAMTDIMRKMMARIKTCPTLTGADRLTLKLGIPDTEPTEIPEPTADVTATFTRESDGMVLKIATPEVADTRPYHGVKIRYAVLDQAAPPPTSNEQLTIDDFITGKKKKYTFDSDYRGKFLYYRLRWESKTGKKGPWGEIKKTLIS